MRPCVHVIWQQASRDWVSQPRFLTDGQRQEGVATTTITAKSRDQGFSIGKKNCNSIHTRIETVDISVTFHLLQLFLTSFRSIGLLLTSLEAGEDKSSIGETFQRAKSETWRKKRERERERERERWGTCIWRTHIHACSTNFFLFFEFVASRYYPSTSQW